VSSAVSREQKAWVDMASGGRVHTALGLGLLGTFSAVLKSVLWMLDNLSAHIAVSKMQKYVGDGHSCATSGTHQGGRVYCVSSTHRPFVTLDPN